MGRPGGLDVGIDGNLWDILQAAEEQIFEEETLPKGEEISTEKDTGTAEVRLPNIQTVVIRTEVITEDQIIMTEADVVPLPTPVKIDPVVVVEPVVEPEPVEKSSVWLILGPTIASGILVLIAIFCLVGRIRNDRIRTL